MTAVRCYRKCALLVLISLLALPGCGGDDLVGTPSPAPPPGETAEEEAG